jgi:hypothetical protein
VRHSSDQIAREIRRYCLAHPNAKDTIDGITWWLQMQRQEDMRVAVSEAVQQLVQGGVLEAYRLQDGSEVFGCKGAS